MHSPTVHNRYPKSKRVIIITTTTVWQFSILRLDLVLYANLLIPRAGPDHST